MIVARFNKAIAEMKEDGTHDRIVQKKLYRDRPENSSKLFNQSFPGYIHQSWYRSM